MKCQAGDIGGEGKAAESQHQRRGRRHAIEDLVGNFQDYGRAKQQDDGPLAIAAPASHFGPRCRA